MPYLAARQRRLATNAESSDGGQRMKINKWTRRHTNAEGDTAPPPEVVPNSGDGGAIQQPPDGLSEAGVREALRDVRDPEIGRDLVSLNMIRAIEIEGSL